jgi:alpha-beta hydrolase superfamily lysophospholipase
VGSFIDDEGVVIETVEWAVHAPRAVVQVSHGIGEHSGRYAALAADLNRAGITVVADDHRGHGVTGMRQWGDPAKLGSLGPGGLRSTVAAISRFGELTRARFPHLPLVLVAHSWGSLMAQMALNRRPDAYDGVVLTGTAYRLPGFMDAGDLNRRHRSLGTTGADALRLLGRPARGLPADLPVLLQVGSDDTLGAARSAERLARAYRVRSGIRDVTVRVYDGARHEVFNETNRDEVVGDLVEWIERHVLAEKEARS